MKEISGAIPLQAACRRENSVSSDSSIVPDHLHPLDLTTRLVVESAMRVAVSDETILILGETGVGKDVLARRIHDASPRARGRFIHINCAAVSEGLIESEMFGHVRGAYTGAVDSQPGHFEMASGGTLFLDEIGELSPRHQAKLLHVLQNRSFSRVGGRVAIDSDARVIAATNQDLDEAIRRGRFRRDLFYRLGVVCLRIPPLRERPDDIVPFARFFASRYAAAYGHDAMAEPTAEVIALLRVHPFEGNVREMENLIKRAILLGSWDTILEELDQPEPGTAAHASDPPRTLATSAFEADGLQEDCDAASFPAADGREIPFVAAAPATPLKEIARRATEQAERRAIARTLAATEWNRRRASRILGISYRALLYKIRDYALTPPSKNRTERAAATVYSLRQGSA